MKEEKYKFTWKIQFFLFGSLYRKHVLLLRCRCCPWWWLPGRSRTWPSSGTCPSTSRPWCHPVKKSSFRYWFYFIEYLIQRSFYIKGRIVELKLQASVFQQFCRNSVCYNIIQIVNDLNTERDIGSFSQFSTCLKNWNSRSFHHYENKTLTMAV